MTTIALDLLDKIFVLTHDGDLTSQDVVLQLRIGIHVGPCYSRLLRLKVPQMGIFGDAGIKAAIVHSTGLGRFFLFLFFNNPS